jgi:membrane-associated phospholipid phosphatase
MALTARHAAAAEVVVLLALAVGGSGPGGRARRGAALRIGLALPVAIVAVAVLGRTVDRRRPFARVAEPRPLVAHAPGRSFPSRHTACAVAMAIIATPGSPIAGRIMGGLAAALAISRIYVGLHFPTDVLAGAAVGTAVGLLARQWE